jgi:hypothetical protein
MRGDPDAEDPEAADGQLLPERRGRALPEGRQGARRGSGGDVRDRHEHAQGPARRGEARHRQALEGPGQLHREVAGRRRGGAAVAPARRRAHPLRVARRHVREVPSRGACRLHGRRHGDRLRRTRLAARPGGIRRRHRVLRLLARVPASGARPGRHRRRARHLRRPRGAQEGDIGGLPGRRVAALRRAPDAGLRARGWLALPLETGRQDRRPGVPGARTRTR